MGCSEAGAEGNPGVEAFRAVALAQHARLRRAPVLTTSRYVGRLADRPYDKPYILRISGQNASDSDVRQAAQRLLATTDVREQTAHFWMFAEKPFPFDPRPIVALAEVDDPRLRVAALDALAQMSHPEVRLLGLQLRSDVLLIENFESGDHRRVLNWFAGETDRHRSHYYSLRDFWSQHPDEATEVKMLLALSERGFFPAYAAR